MALHKPLSEELSGLLLHVLVFCVGGLLLSLVWMVAVYALLRTVHGFGFIARAVGGIYNPVVYPYFPIALLGALVNRFTKLRSACLVAVFGAVGILVIMGSEVSLYERSEYYRNLAHGHYWRYEFEQLFSPADTNCHDECLGKLLCTVPFLSSVAYSIGAWVGLKFGSVHDRSQPLNV